MNTPEEKYLLIMLHGKLFAIPLEEAAEVEEPIPLSPIPSLSHPYCGAMNHHGRIVAVIDLPSLLGLPPCEKPDKFIIVSPELGDLAFQVEKVIRIATVDQTNLRTKTDEPSFIETIRFREGDAPVLNFSYLLETASSIILKSAFTAN